VPDVAASPRKCCHRRPWARKIPTDAPHSAHREGLVVLRGRGVLGDLVGQRRGAPGGLEDLGVLWGLWGLWGLVGAYRDRRERDLERLRVDHAQERQRRLHVRGAGRRQAVAALTRGRVGVLTRGRVGVLAGMRVPAGLGDDG
jgi:hypothetical protein